MTLLTRRQLILAKEESVYGTDPTPVVGSDAILVRSISATPLESDTVSRELIRPYLGHSEQLLSQTRVAIEFEVELAGSGTEGTAPAYGPLLKACGLSETIVAATSVTYEPVSTSFDSVTIYFNNSGVLHKATGCRGSFTLNAEVGAIPTIAFTFTGIYAAPTDVAISAPTYANQADPLIFKNGNTSSFQLLSFAGALQAFSFDLGNNLVYRELVGGTKEVLLTDRAGTGSTTIEAVSIASKDYFAAALTDTSLGNLDFTHGSTAGNIVDFASTRVDIGDVSYSDQDGIAMFNIPYTCVPSTSGNDEFSLAYT
jgi:hypothetical protein